MQDYLIKQHPAKEQSELKVRIKMPGSWFGGLRPTEKIMQYEVQAFNFEDAYHFPCILGGHTGRAGGLVSCRAGLSTRTRQACRTGVGLWGLSPHTG